MQKKIEADEFLILARLAARLLTESKFVEAAAVARRLTDLVPTEGEGWYILGSALIALDEVDEAEHCLQKALQAGFEAHSYYRQMARLSMQRGDMTSAIVWWERAVAIETDSIPIFLELANAYKVAGEFQKAIKTVEQCVRLSPFAASVRVELAELYLTEHDYHRAEEQLRTALTNESANKSAVWSRLGYALSRQDKHHEALEAFGQAVDLEPNNPAYLYDLGDCYLKLENPQKALGFLQRSIERKRDFPIGALRYGASLLPARTV